MRNSKIYLNEKNYIYYKEVVKRKKLSLLLIRFFDLFFSFFGVIFLIPLFIFVSILIKITSKGPIFFKQERVGKNQKIFKILKFRTMIVNAEEKGLKISTSSDNRITKIGKILRKTKIDEFPQLINVFFGQMSFVGPRPEVKKYVDLYTENQKSVFLIKPGITDLASIEFRNENEILNNAENPEKIYINNIMQKKLDLNLFYIEKIGFFYNIYLIFKTLFVVIVR